MVSRRDEADERLSRLLAGTRDARAGTSRLASNIPDEEEESTIARLINFGLTAEPVFNAVNALTQTFEESPLGEAVPGHIPEIDREALPAWARFTADTLLSPVGLLSMVAAPVTGGLSLAPLMGARMGTSIAARGITRILPELLVSAAASGGGRVGEALTPEGAPDWVKLSIPLVTGILAGGGAGVGLRQALASQTSREVLMRTITDQAAAVGNKHVGKPLSFDQALETINDDQGFRSNVLNLLGFDKSRHNDIATDRIIALVRTYVSGDSQATITVSAALRNGFKGSFKTDRDGFVSNVTGRVHAGDMLEIDDAPTRFGFTDAQTETWTRAREIIEDNNRLLDLWGIKRNKLKIAGRTYFPRDPNARRGIDFEARADRFENRLWDTTQEGVEVGGVSYDDIDSILVNYTKTTYQAIAEKEFLESATAIGITPARAAKFTNEGKIAQLKIKKAKGEVRKLRRDVLAMRAGGESGRALDDAEASLLKWNTQLEDARAEWADVTEKTFHQLPGNLFGLGEENVSVGQWNGRFYLRDQQKKLLEWTSLEPSSKADITGKGITIRTPQAAKGLRNLQDVTNLLRATTATADVAAPMIQGLALFAHDPVLWSKMAAKSTMAFFSPQVQTNYIAKNKDILIDMIQNGRIVPGDVEMFKALSSGGFPEKILKHSRFAKRTGLGATVGRFQTSYDTSLLIMRAELWKSMKPRWQGTMEELGAVIRHATGGMETRSIGLGPNQRAVESLAMFAPRLTRSMLAYVADATRPWTAQGQEAAHNLLRFSAAMAGLFTLANVVSGTYNGETPEQIEERVTNSLNPTKGRQFLSVQVGDAWYGVGGTIRSTLQFVTRAVTDPASLVGEGAIDNPLVSYASGRQSPFASAALGFLELSTGEEHNFLPFEYIDSPLDLAKITASGMLPFALQSVIEEARVQGLGGIDPRGEGGIGSSFTEFFGARTSPATPYDILRDEARRRHNGREWAELTDTERDAIISSTPDLQKRMDEFDNKAEREYRKTTADNDTKAKDTMLAAYQQVQSGKMTREQLREVIDIAQHDRFVQNQEAREHFGIDFGEPSTVRARVLDAYYQTFEDAALTPGSTQIDSTKWEELKAALERRVQSGEFGPAAEAQRFLDERRKFELPEQLQWFTANAKVLQDTGYWEVKDEVFEKYRERLAQYGIDDVQQLEPQIGYALQTGDRATGIRLRRVLNRINEETSTLRQRMRRRNPAIEKALRENGHIDVPLRG